LACQVEVTPSSSSNDNQVDDEDSFEFYDCPSIEQLIANFVQHQQYIFITRKKWASKATRKSAGKALKSKNPKERKGVQYSSNTPSYT
jgi:hypothetical protein